MADWQTSDDYFEEGRRARQEGRGRFDNPYEDIAAAMCWDDGWEAEGVAFDVAA